MQVALPFNTWKKCQFHLVCIQIISFDCNAIICCILYVLFNTLTPVSSKNSNQIVFKNKQTNKKITHSFCFFPVVFLLAVSPEHFIKELKHMKTLLIFLFFIQYSGFVALVHFRHNSFLVACICCILIRVSTHPTIWFSIPYLHSCCVPPHSRRCSCTSQ